MGRCMISFSFLQQPKEDILIILILKIRKQKLKVVFKVNSKEVTGERFGENQTRSTATWRRVKKLKVKR